MPHLDLETLLTWVGVGLVALAGIFLVSTAISRGWIGPELQLAGATVGGWALVAGGGRLAGHRRPWGVALAIGGVVVTTMAASASFVWLDLVSPGPALLWLIASTVALGAVAVALDSRAVAATAATAGLVLSLWIDDRGELPLLAVGGWLTAATVGWAVLGLVRRWDVVRLVGATLGAWLLLLAVGALADGPSGGILVAALVAGAVAALAGAVGPVLAERREPGVGGVWRALDHRSLLTVPLVAWLHLGASIRFDDVDRYGLAGLAMAVVFLAGLAVAVVLGRRPPDGARPGLLALSVTTLMGVTLLITASLAVAAEGPVVLVAIAVQAAALALVAHRLDDLPSALQSGLFSVIAGVWTAVLVIEGLTDPLTAGQLVASALVVTVAGAAAWYTRRQGLTTPAVLAAVVAWTGALGWLAAALVHGPQGQVVVSGLWAAAAAAALAWGVARSDATARMLGLATLAVVLVKLLTVDLAEVDTLWRVGLFLVIGAGLLRLGYVLPRLSARSTSTGSAAGS